MVPLRHHSKRPLKKFSLSIRGMEVAWAQVLPNSDFQSFAPVSKFARLNWARLVVIISDNASHNLEYGVPVFTDVNMNTLQRLFATAVDDIIRRSSSSSGFAIDIDSDNDGGDKYCGMEPVDFGEILSPPMTSSQERGVTITASIAAAPESADLISEAPTSSAYQAVRYAAHHLSLIDRKYLALLRCGLTGTWISFWYVGLTPSNLSI